MTNKNFLLKKSSVILFVLLPGLFISDIAYGWMQIAHINLPFTPGTAIRGGLFFVAFCIALVYSRTLGRQYILFLGILVFLGLLGPLYAFTRSGSISILGADIQRLTKALYCPVVLALFIILVRREHLSSGNVLRFVEYAAYFIGGTLFLSNATGFGGATYGSYAFGNKGIYFSQNDLTLSLGIAMLPAIYANITQPSITRMALLIAAMAGLLSIGTRTSFIVVSIIPLISLFIVVWTKSEFARRKIVTIIMFLVIGAIALVSAYFALQNQLSYEYQKQRIDVLVSGELPRALLMRAGFSYLGQREVYQNVIGEGSYFYESGVYARWVGILDAQRKAVEVDWVDLYGAYGIFFAVFLYGFYLSLLYLAFRRFFVQRSAFNGIMMFMLLIYLGHSVLAGHALANPMPGTLIAAAGALILARPKPGSEKTLLQL